MSSDRIRALSLFVLIAAVAFGCALDATRATAEAPDGEALFELACATCHLGGGGLLGAPRTPDLFRDELSLATGPEEMRAVIRDGIGPPRMPSFQRGLDPAEIDAIVDYVLAQRGAIRPAP
jgi:mono/diheme cytochrome c family protein